jgi:hypothetical protein
VALKCPRSSACGPIDLDDFARVYQEAVWANLPSLSMYVHNCQEIMFQFESVDKASGLAS